MNRTCCMVTTAQSANGWQQLCIILVAHPIPHGQSPGEDAKARTARGRDRRRPRRHSSCPPLQQEPSNQRDRGQGAVEKTAEEAGARVCREAHGTRDTLHDFILSPPVSMDIVLALAGGAGKGGSRRCIPRVRWTCAYPHKKKRWSVWWKDRAGPHLRRGTSASDKAETMKKRTRLPERALPFFSWRPQRTQFFLGAYTPTPTATTRPSPYRKGAPSSSFVLFHGGMVADLPPPRGPEHECPRARSRSR
jgi:hypothetical protein